MTTTTETFNKQYPIALQALAEHIQTHHLPPLTAIDIVEDHHHGAAPATKMIRLRLPATTAQQDAWLNSVCIDDEVSFEVDQGHRHLWSARLPDTGARFELAALRCHPVWKFVSA